MNEIFAYLFDMLKAKSPTIAAVVLLILGTAHAFFSNPTSVEIIGQTATSIGYWVSLIWMALQGSRTVSFLATDKPIEKK